MHCAADRGERDNTFQDSEHKHERAVSSSGRIRGNCLFRVRSRFCCHADDSPISFHTGMAAPLVICYFPFLNTNAVSHHKETFIKWIFSKVICLCPKGLVNVKIYFELKKTFFHGLLFRLLMIVCVVLFPLKMHMLPRNNDPCIIFSLKNASLSSKYAIFIRDLCPETRYPAWPK